MVKFLKHISGIFLCFLALFLLFRTTPEKVYQNITSSFLQFSSQSLVPTLKNIEEKLLLPIPLIVSKQSTSGVLTRAGVIADTNREREKAGLKPLAEDETLDKVAAAKLADLFAKQYFEHESPTGVGPGDLAKDAGYEYLVVGENLALGQFDDDADIVAAWMASPGHRANILNTRFTEIGVAVGRHMYKGEMVWIGVQEFGLPLSACPSPNAAFKIHLDNEQATLDAEKKVLDSMRATLEQIPTNDPAYNSTAKAYNAEVAVYNSLLATIKSDIATYNQDVAEVNACRSKK